MDAATLASRLDYVCSLLRLLPTDQPARLVVNDDDFTLLIDTDDALQALRAMFLPGTVVRQTRPGTWLVRLDGVVVLVQRPQPEPGSYTVELKL